MDLKNLKKVFGVGLLTAAAITTSPAQAATGNINVDLDFPTVLVMYYYSDINIEIAQEALGQVITGGPSTCAGDWCVDEGAAGDFMITTSDLTGAVATVTPTAVGGGGVSNTVLNIVLEDVVGARAIGCGPTGVYDANYTVAGTAGVVAAPSQAVGTLDGAACSLTLETGSVNFDVNFDQLASNDTAQATLAVTVNGI